MVAARAQRLGQTLLHMVADHTLAHRAAYVKRHRGGNVDGGLVLQHDAPDLRAVAVRKHDMVSLFNDIRNVSGGFFNHFELRFRRCRAVALLQSVAAQGDDKFFHEN
ncbi:hypothetical protein SDC9_146429 [bioreactor metagenome]|uniref:Uncharacterized protein n=1 Tax=bioreactor metagenome TaxID=1076179 RepID=A0A645EDN4_9ZZZZ